MDILEYLKINSPLALAFSGGTDSALLCYLCKKADVDFTAFYVNTAFQPRFELEDAKRLAKELGFKMKVIEFDVLANKEVAKNPKNRCYICKKEIFGRIINAAKNDGYNIIIDGTNASDKESDRPGMKALSELKVLSPLRECGITKAEVRKMSKEYGLFTHDKPSYACLATRFAVGETLTLQGLQKVEKSEQALMKLGFSNFRARFQGKRCTLALVSSQHDLFWELLDEIEEVLKPYCSEIMLDKPRYDEFAKKQGGKK